MPMSKYWIEYFIEKLMWGVIYMTRPQLGRVLVTLFSTEFVPECDQYQPNVSNE